MLQYLPQPEAMVTPGVPRLLQEGYYVRFTEQWPLTLPHVKGKFFTIGKTNQVPYNLSYIIPESDYVDVDMSNNAGGVNLYPENTKTLYEVSLGFKQGNYLVDFYIPAGEFVNRLEQPGMVPTLTSATLRYLGAVKPTDSPCEDPRILMYFVKDLEPMILRTFVDTGMAIPDGAADFPHEKCIFCLIINKCYLTEIQNPTTEQWNRSKKIDYYTELRW